MHDIEYPPPAPLPPVIHRLPAQLLLFGLLLWQNPILAVEEWVVGDFSDTWLWARFARDLCQCVGLQVGGEGWGVNSGDWGGGGSFRA